jgi:hypothetical protein
MLQFKVLLLRTESTPCSVQYFSIHCVFYFADIQLKWLCSVQKWTSQFI